MPGEAATWLRASPDGIVIAVHVQPGARSTCASGMHGGVPKIRLAAPAREGEANAELIRFLSRAIGAPRSGISIVAGLASRDKRVSISGDARILGPAVREALASGDR